MPTRALPVILCLSLLLLSAQDIFAREYYTVQVGNFSSIENALRVVNELKKYTTACTVQAEGKYFKVRCGQYFSREDARKVKDRLVALGAKDAFLLSTGDSPFNREREDGEPGKVLIRGLSVKKESVVKEAGAGPSAHESPAEAAVATEPAVAEPPVQEAPATQPSQAEPSSQEPSVKEPPGEVNTASEEGISGTIFERWKGYVHPSLMVTEYYTDNVFNTRNDRQSDFITVISPGIGFTLPRINETLTGIQTNYLAPGGATMTWFMKRFPSRIQANLSYGADIERYARFASQNVTDQAAQGVLQYNLRGGLSLDLYEGFLQTHTIPGLPGSGLVNINLQKYDTNLLDIALNYEISDKWNFRADYSNFFVHFINIEKDFRNRTDNSFSGYVFYKVGSKTQLFAQYECVDSNYENDTLNNSTENNFYGGVQWDITAKTSGSLKGGYGSKNFSDSATGRTNTYLVEAQLKYKFTPKSAISLIATRQPNETDVALTDYMIADILRVEYTQRLTYKLNTIVRLSFEEDNYKNEISFANETNKLEDRYYGGSIALQYDFREWLKAELGYLYYKRDSSFPALDYSNNTAYFKITASM